MASSAADRNALVSQLADNWSSHEIRSLAQTLLRLADSVDQNWDGGNVHSVFRWPSALSRIERNAYNLATKARLIAEHRARRPEFVDPDVLGEPAWDMLLDLFMQYAGGAKVSTSSLCIAARVPMSTALRYIAMLEAKDYIKRTPSAHDGRVTLVSLNDAGVLAVGRYLEQF